jgi:hypothetical protein
LKKNGIENHYVATSKRKNLKIDDKHEKVNKKIVCLFVLSRTSNFSAIWRLSPLPATGLQI